VNKSKLTTRSRKTTKRERIVVVGAGLAGLRSAERLRELGFTGEVVMIGAERRRPYHRPALSKQMLTGELRPKDLTLRSYVPLDAIWRRGAQVLKLDARRHVVELPGDEEIRYDGLVIATGVEPRHLPGAPRHDPRVHMLRTMGDAIGLQRGIASGSGRVVVIGGGFTACEVASTARELGCEVTILSRSKVLLGRVVGDTMGEQIAELHRANGVQVELGVEVSHWLTQPWGITMQLDNGKTISAGTVVLAVGSTPSVQWLRGSGLTLEDGVLCRPTCHVVGANDVVAAGDVARWPNLRFEATPRRVEHWMNAVDMGRAAAESLLAGPEAAKPFTPLPRFWSEQHGMHLQAAGMPALSQDSVPLARRSGARGITGYVRNGRLIGIVARDDPRGMISWTEELKRELRRPETVTMPAIQVETSGTAKPELVVESKPTPKPEPRPQPAMVELEPIVRQPPPVRREPTVRPRPPVPRGPVVPREPVIAREPVVQRQPVVRREPAPYEPAPYEPAHFEPVARYDQPPRQPVGHEPTVRHEWAGSGPAIAWSQDPSMDFTQEHPTMAHFFSELPAMLDNPPAHPSQPNMRPVPRPMPDDRPEHPSHPNMRPVPRPMPDDRPEHPSRPNMRSVPRPPVDDRPEHPSRPNMQPVPRPKSTPRLWATDPDPLPEHPSLPNMHPVARPMTDAERRHEQELLEWQFAQGRS
jgi:NADPH-dependent 2,4-dienoyl-CoA reductase/sulfur reductase-like enzyme